MRLAAEARSLPDAHDLIAGVAPLAARRAADSMRVVRVGAADHLPARTRRKRAGRDFIERYRTQHEYPPTVREIGGAVGLASPATVHRHLVDLVEMGALERVPRRARTRWAARRA